MVGVLATAAVAGLIGRAWFWREQARQLQVPGFLPPPPSLAGRALLRGLSRLGVFFFVGPIDVVDTRQDAHAPPTMIIVNHQFELDFMVVASALRTAFRHLGRAPAMVGIRGMAAAFSGFFAAPVERGRARGDSGAAIVDAGARVIGQNPRCPVLWFAQGHLVYDNVLREEDFRTGAIRALQRARELGLADGSATVLPMYVTYRRHPRDATRGWRFAQRLGLRRFRRFVRMRDDGGVRRRESLVTHGARAVVGRPIALEDLPADPREAIEIVRQELLRLAALVEPRERRIESTLQPV